MATRAELVGAIGERYPASARAEKRRILDEFVSVTGYHRKHAIRLLRPIRRELPESKRVSHRRYGEAVRTALIVLWEASDRVCSKRLKPPIEVLLSALERHGKLAVEATVRAQLEASLREAIRDGRLRGGERLPSSRELARALGVSRGMVQECYGQLLAEGYLTSRTWRAAT